MCELCEGITDESFAGTFKNVLRPPRLWVALPAVASVSSDRLHKLQTGGLQRGLGAEGGYNCPRRSLSPGLSWGASTELLAAIPDSRLQTRSSSAGSLHGRSGAARRRRSQVSSSAATPAERHRLTLLQFHALNCDVDAAELRRTFRRKLLRRYRFTIVAWRILDPTRRGCCSYVQVVQAAQQLGCINDARAVWEALDEDRDGLVTLADVDPQTAKLLGDFARALLQVCGSAEAAWKTFFSIDGPLCRCSEMEFLTASTELGLASIALAAFAALSGEGPGVCPDDFCMLDKWFRHNKTAAEPGSPKAAWRYFGPAVGLAPPLDERLIRAATPPVPASPPKGRRSSVEF